MKVPGSINSLFQTYRENAEITRTKCEEKLETWCKKKGYYFESRIKKLDSFAQKIETGRYIASNIDDVYACTVVVRTRLEIEECISELKSNFSFRLNRQVPENISISSRAPQTFDFDSVRLYFKPPSSEIGREQYEDQLFEIQVKTLIEQAWSIATHEFQYKSDATSWARSRISSQIKALLDTAELAIVEAENLALSPVVQKQDNRLDRLHEIISYFKTEWENDKLPKDLKRLAENVQNLLKPINKDVPWLKELINDATLQSKGKSSLNLAPYWIIFQTIVDVEGKSFFDVIESKKNHYGKPKFRMSIIDEIEIPHNVNLDEYQSFHKL